MPQTALPFGRKAVIWTIRVVLAMMVFPALVVSVYAIVTLRQKHSDGVVSLAVLALVLWMLFFALYLTGLLFEKRIGSRFVRYFADNPLSRNWFDIVDPSMVLGIATVDIGKPEYLADRKAIKEAFKAFGLVVNVADGSAVSFPAASVGKMLYQSGVDIHGIAGAFKSLFESSIRVWNEREVPMEGHKFHFNVGAYRNYLNKFTDGKGEYYIRFTVREIGKDSSVHASTISEVAIYGKNEGARTDSHPENPEDGSKAPFTDNKIALYLSYVNGGWK